MLETLSLTTDRNQRSSEWLAVASDEASPHSRTLAAGIQLESASMTLGRRISRAGEKYLEQVDTCTGGG